MKVDILKTISIVLVIGYVCTSCQKENTTSVLVSEEQVIVEEDIVVNEAMENTVDKLNTELQRLENFNYNVQLSLKSARDDGEICKPEVTVIQEEDKKFPKLVTIDYGAGCTDENGNVRTGKVKIEITDSYWTKGSKREVKFLDYTFNDLKIKGERKVINEGIDEKGRYVFNAKFEGKVEINDTISIEREAFKKRFISRGENLKDKWDDEIWVEGYFKGIGIRGNDYCTKITETLYRPRTCRYFVSGEKLRKVEDKPVAIISYGNGECDKVATLTRNGKTKEIELGKKPAYFKIVR